MQPKRWMFSQDLCRFCIGLDEWDACVGDILMAITATVDSYDFVEAAIQSVWGGGAGRWLCPSAAEY